MAFDRYARISANARSLLTISTDFEHLANHAAVKARNSQRQILAEQATPLGNEMLGY